MNMADSLEIMRLKLRKQNILLSKATMEVRIAEMEEEKRRISENFPLYEKEIAEIETAIARLQNPEGKE